MRSILLVWTLRSYTVDDRAVDKDYYEVFEDETKARDRYSEVLKEDHLVTASLTGVIDSTDYEPYVPTTDSEKQLEEFITYIGDREPTTIELRTQGDETGIFGDKAIFICAVIDETTGREYLFGGISQAFYDKMVEKYYSYGSDNEDSEWDRVEVIDEVEELLIQKWVEIGIDKPDNHWQIREFIAEDIMETACRSGWHSGDFDIAFRRWIEAQTE